jgi:hypothetical protein
MPHSPSTYTASAPIRGRPFIQHDQVIGNVDVDGNARIEMQAR